MQPVSLQSDIEAIDERFVDAVVAVSGLNNVLVLETFLGVDRETGAYMDPPAKNRADVYIEWRRWPGRFGLEVSLYGPTPLLEQMSEAEFTRRLARELGRPLVISDCDADPWSYFQFAVDGAVRHVYTVPDDEEGRPLFDLACDLDPSDPGYWAASLIWAGGEPLPPKPADAPDHMPRELQRFCHDQNADDRLCSAFWAPCPKRRFSGVEK